MKDFWKRLGGKAAGMLLLAALLLAVLSAVGFLGGGIMNFFGFQYDHIGSVILFFILGGLISFPLNAVAEAVPKLLYRRGRMRKVPAAVFCVALDTAATAFGLWMADRIMGSVSASGLSVWVAAFVFALFELEDFRKKPTE